MPDVIVYGASDDLLEVKGYITDEFDVYGETRVRFTAPDGEALDVYAIFGVPGAGLDWTLGIEARDAYPNWSIHFSQRPDYEGDPALVISVPVGTTVRKILGSDEED